MVDVGCENIATAATLSELLLIEFVLREYFGGLKTSLRTFIEQFIMVSVTIRTRSDRILYQFHANPRNPRSTGQLREASSVITGRALRRSGRLMIFEVIDAAAARGGWPTSGG